MNPLLDVWDRVYDVYLILKSRYWCRLYYCPLADDIECCQAHSGFNVCCSKPEDHVLIEKTPEFDVCPECRSHHVSYQGSMSDVDPRLDSLRCDSCSHEWMTLH